MSLPTYLRPAITFGAIFIALNIGAIFYNSYRDSGDEKAEVSQDTIYDRSGRLITTTHLTDEQMKIQEEKGCEACHQK